MYVCTFTYSDSNILMMMSPILQVEKNCCTILYLFGDTVFSCTPLSHQHPKCLVGKNLKIQYFWCFLSSWKVLLIFLIKINVRFSGMIKIRWKLIKNVIKTCEHENWMLQISQHLALKWSKRKTIKISKYFEDHCLYE